MTAPGPSGPLRHVGPGEAQEPAGPGELGRQQSQAEEDDDPPGTGQWKKHDTGDHHGGPGHTDAHAIDEVRHRPRADVALAETVPPLSENGDCAVRAVRAPRAFRPGDGLMPQGHVPLPVRALLATGSARLRCAAFTIRLILVSVKENDAGTEDVLVFPRVSWHSRPGTSRGNSSAPRGE